MSYFYRVSYQYLYEEDGSAICIDVNECTAGKHMCSPDAQCINQEGSHTCQCRPGFSGDGRTCDSKLAVYQRKLGLPTGNSVEKNR